MADLGHMVEPIAYLRTCYPEKFGVPRQSGLVPSAWGVIEFEPAYRRPEAVVGLDAFSHLWLIFQFHLVPQEAISLSVRPPRLGGNERRGVFATRSPFRPNRLGLSCVAIDRVEAGVPRIYVTGIDLVDGTPILDIKPYLPYADALPDANGGFANAAPALLPVRWICERVMGTAADIIEQSIALQPQPAYHQDSQRRYTATIADCSVTWRVAESGAEIINCGPVG
jgi:tRNA (adenine37-N6)-methyltransferase